MEVVHKSVLLNETLEYLKPDHENSVYIDGTLGEGGHMEAFLTRYPDLTGIGIDADPAIQAKAKKRLAVFGERVSFRRSWFDRYFKEYSEDRRPDRVLLDLGISMFHYRESERGFSFDKNEPLDMRLNPDSEITAADIVNTWPEKEIADLIFQLSDERNSRKIARNIVLERKKEKIETADRLAYIVRGSFAGNSRYGKIHPATRTFQALRIAVNSELDRIPEAINAICSVLNEGGRLAVISFHSHEDRIVKRLFRQLSSPSEERGAVLFRVLTKKPVVPGEDEIERNSASRSSKMRVIEKLAAGEGVK